jgi:hypothetical protein
VLRLNLPDLEACGERRVGQVIKVWADHRIAEPDRPIAGPEDDRFSLRRRVAAEGFEHLVARRIRGGQLPEMILHGRQHERKHLVGWHGRIEEREDLVDAWSVEFLVDASADVADDPIVELDESHVTGRVEIRRVLVVVLHLRAGGREVVARRRSRRVGDLIHRRVIVRGAQMAEYEPGDVGQWPGSPEDVGYGRRVVAGHQSSVK